MYKRQILEYFGKSTGLNEQKIRQILANFQFYQDDIKKRVGKLSGGEKMKIKLAELLQEKINTLVLDEPTNHIDIDTKEVFENALEDFDGTIIFVSHDRFFINAIANRVLNIEDYKIKSYYGNYDDFTMKNII
mgnify:CR=1 FL=1